MYSIIVTKYRTGNTTPSSATTSAVLSRHTMIKVTLSSRQTIDIYGNLRNLHGSRKLIPFRQIGQYEDNETCLYYNRSRYYDPRIGNYISQDPISLAENNLTLYGYVSDPNVHIDPFRLRKYFVYQAYELDAKGNRTGKIYTGRTKRR